MLYIYVILKRASPPESYREYFSAATQCQCQISGIAEKGSLPERYCLLLEELRTEALRQTEHMHSSAFGSNGGHSYLEESGVQTRSVPTDNDLGHAIEYMDSMGDNTTDFAGMVPESVESNYADWGHFATMVSSGLGNLDAFLNDDPFML